MHKSDSLIADDILSVDIILTFLGTAVVWAGLCLVYIFIVKENYLATTNFIIRLLDNVATITGVVATILMMLRFVEYVPLQITGLFSGLAIYSIMLPSEPAQITYIIYSVYSSICAFIAIHNMRKRYRKQQEDLAKTTNE